MQPVVLKLTRAILKPFLLIFFRMSRIGRRFYMATQSRIHVLVTHAFLRSLARLDLAESRVGRFAAPRHDGGAAAEQDLAAR